MQFGGLEEISGTFNANENNEENTTPKKTYARWRKSDPSTWSKNVEKKKKFNCLPYKTRKGIKPAKGPQSVDCGSCKFKCSQNISEKDRISICKKYWSLSEYKRQKDFILKMVQTKKPIRPLANVPVNKRRKCSRAYFLISNDKKYRVCQNFFQKTLNISNGPINKAFEGSDDGVFTAEDKRGKRSPHNKTKQEDVAFVKQHIEMFPTMESHYCRKNTHRRYLDAKLSIRKMFSLYSEYCKENNRIPVSHSMYRKIFCECYNLSFFVPKKDQCALCNKYADARRSESLTPKLEQTYNAHLERKRQAAKAKEEDKVRSENDPIFMSITLDLQSVLQIPSGEESLLYYCRKLCLYNFTIYESRSPNEAYCMLWSEVNGKRGSNEIGTALMQWINGLPEGIKEISLFSDTCGGQNRNQHISALLLYVTRTSQIEIIEQKYLESGHSFMEVDSMHSAIEREKRHVSVNSVMEWISIMKRARSKRNRSTANPYHVKQLHFSDMLDLKHLSKCLIKNRLKDENGNTVKWLEIKCLRYEKANPDIIKFRYNYNDPYILLNVRGRGRKHSVNEIKRAYHQLLPISKQKKEDLMKLCKKEIIPEELHAWYASLPSANIPDTTNEPAVEDEEEESLE